MFTYLSKAGGVEAFEPASRLGGVQIVEAMDTEFDPHPALRGVGIAIGLVEPLTERRSIMSRG